MKIFIFVVCLALVNASEFKDGNEVLIGKIVEGFSSLKSSKCKSDLNRTANAFHERKPWAIASKNEFTDRVNFHSKLLENTEEIPDKSATTN